MSALHIAASAGDIPTANKLLQEGSPVDSLDAWGNTPLLAAISNNHQALVETLLASGANIHFRTRVAMILNNGPEISSNPEMLRIQALDTLYWLKKGEKTAGYTPLHTAARQGHVGIIKVLLDQGAEVNAVNNFDSPPLFEAVYYGHSEAISLLLEAGADVTIRDENGNTALQLAQGFDQAEVIALLEQYGAIE